MVKYVLNLLKTRKYIIQGILFLITFLFIFFMVDYLNMSYKEMTIRYGTYLVVINILLNIIMSFLSALMMNLSTAMVQVKVGTGKGANLGFFSVLFGILTYGCTSCVIAFLAVIGISFSVTVLPLAGLPYKLISLLLILIGMWWIIREIKNGTCKIKDTKSI